jgi:DNA invertase Pin-like site-specific DNA recombinase
LLELSETLSKRGIDLASVTESIDTSTPAGRMVFTVMSAMAQFERELLIERVILIHAAQKRKGERVGAVPFGKKLGPDGKNYWMMQGSKKLSKKPGF